MAGMVAPIADERAGLLAYLEQQRYVIKLTAYGLTDEEARLHAGREPVERRRTDQARGLRRRGLDRHRLAARPRLG